MPQGHEWWWRCLCVCQHGAIKDRAHLNCRSVSWRVSTKHLKPILAPLLPLWKKRAIMLGKRPHSFAFLVKLALFKLYHPRSFSNSTSHSVMSTALAIYCIILTSKACTRVVLLLLTPAFIHLSWATLDQLAPHSPPLKHEPLVMFLLKARLLFFLRTKQRMNRWRIMLVQMYRR